MKHTYYMPGFTFQFVRYMIAEKKYALRDASGHVFTMRRADVRRAFRLGIANRVN